MIHRDPLRLNFLPLLHPLPHRPPHILPPYPLPSPVAERQSIEPVYSLSRRWRAQLHLSTHSTPLRGLLPHPNLRRIPRQHPYHPQKFHITNSFFLNRLSPMKCSITPTQALGLQKTRIESSSSHTTHVTQKHGRSGRSGLLP